jgi:hypothetical protein
MFAVCESENNVNRLMYSLRVKSVNCRVKNADAKHDNTDKYSNVQVRCSYQLCCKLSFNRYDFSEYRIWDKENFVESFCRETRQLNRLSTVDPACRDSSELIKDMQPKRLVFRYPNDSNDIYVETPLQLQSFHIIGLSRYCGVESSRRIGKGFKTD